MESIIARASTVIAVLVGLPNVGSKVFLDRKKNCHEHHGDLREPQNFVLGSLHVIKELTGKYLLSYLIITRDVNWVYDKVII